MSSVQPTLAKKRPRLFYLDFIRALATVLIVITHFNNPFMTGHMIFFNRPFGIYIGGLGVSLFLIISGAALMYTHGDDEHLGLKRFYWKRFKTIYPMFWCAFIIANAFLFIRQGHFPYNGVPKQNILYSVFGVDGIIAFTPIPTFYTLGEWFLGFIIIFYIVFPLLRAGVRNHPWLTGAIILALYVASLLVTLPQGWPPKSVFLTTRLPEIAFGMYFARYWKRIPLLAAIAAIALLFVQQFTQKLPEDFATTIVGICAFVVLVYIAKFFDHQAVRIPTGSIAKYSYPIYLVHHQVIIQVFASVNPGTLTTSTAYLLFIVDCILILSLAFALDKFTTSVLQYFRSMFQSVTGSKQSIVAL